MYENDVIGVGDKLCLLLEAVRGKIFIRHDKSVFQVVKQREKIRMPRDMGGEI